jgi:hypothetical protein
VSRLSSVSSQDSGFTSQEQFFARPPSPLEEAEVNLLFCFFMKRQILTFSGKLMAVLVLY